MVKVKKKAPRKIKAARPHLSVLSTCDHCDQDHHEDIKGIGNTHRFHKTSLNKRPFCNTHFSLNNPDVVAYCSSEPFWKKLRKQKIKLGTLRPSRRERI